MKKLITGNKKRALGRLIFYLQTKTTTKIKYVKYAYKKYNHFFSGKTLKVEYIMDVCIAENHFKAYDIFAEREKLSNSEENDWLVMPFEKYMSRTDTKEYYDLIEKHSKKNFISS